MRTKTTFDSYYDRFWRNSNARKTWTLHFLDGSERVGVPYASSIVDFARPRFLFWDNDENRVFTVPFHDIKSAEDLAQNLEPVTEEM